MVTRLQQHCLRCVLISLSCSPVVVFAQTEWMECPVPETIPVGSDQRPSSLPPQAVYIEADTALFRAQGLSTMEGNVHVSQGDKALRADRASYQQPEGIVSGSGNVGFSSGNMQLRSSELHYDLGKETGEMQDAEYYLQQADGHGYSKRVVQDPPGLTRLENSTYTTCPADSPDWSLNATTINLLHDEERGTASNATLKIRNVPVLYLPYFSFPLTDARKSGFLWPIIGSNERSGLQLSIPYYFNLAPNYDLTLTPTLLGRRGLQLGSEYRYLTEKHKGTLTYALLPDDRASDKNNRYYFNVQNNTRLGSVSSLELKAEGVSDDQYFVDLGNSLESTSVVNLERRLEYRTAGENWSFSSLLQNYQVLDGGVAPHARLPQLLLRYRPPQRGNGLNLSTETEFTHFSGSKTETNGTRLDLSARVSKKFSTDAAYIRPSLTLHHTEYDLDNATETRITRSLPSASLDTGLFFERNIKDGRYVQTLEPRLFYTYTPYRDQSNIPVFDSSKRSLSYDQLFAENRFTGKDRIGDTNRLSASLTTRVQSPDDGRELFRASIGQMYYFDDRKVTLPDEAPVQGDKSELILEAAGEINPRTRLSSTAYWDSGENTFNAGEVRLRYKDDKQRIVNVGYAQRKDDFESASLSFSVPVNPRWKAIGAWEHDLQNDRDLETVIGAEYESCCWKTRVASRNYLLPDNTTRDNAVFVELELKGLGNFGSGTRDLLRDRVYGYE
ncbi:LPS-assembly protein LptD [Thiothrix nivea]|uniref:LPS-assembly protein LptD n=1 Tax=Thiothrix nivea (strain ATCC 35100 / DSM 5205 / JP2) TaxID=870187 RepID=A0A656H8F4_THINJ|nr:LPS assembly protein LptD [Thiothrix nivea]EIJ32811.1 LPS-assembly protein lptD [Thiothrix nivea DSM 5205]